MNGAYLAVFAMILIVGQSVLAQQTHPTGEESNVQTPSSSGFKHTNLLIHATSPYLLQHAHNPVNWHEWGDEALKLAKKEDKLIFLSIGYSACHWCHVMEHESFETEEVAALLNKNFISIKVDREERPDIDEIYMAYTQSRTGRGGWPMSVWLTPNAEPFHAGTYYPKAQFMQILNQIAEAWTNNRDAILNGANAANDFFAQWEIGPAPVPGVIKQAVVDRTADALASYFDKSSGGISGGGTNKFPPSMAMDLMQRVYKRTHHSDLFAAVKATLDNMARGGIYDHVGGGICRYSTDRQWLVPHFEKMLYDQALVSSIYLDGYQESHDALYAYVAGDILDYVLDDLRSADGPFYSSRDADSEGKEGKFYIWTVAQVVDVLGPDDAKLFCDYYDVTEKGNWFEHRGHAPPGPKNILRILKTPAQFSTIHDISIETLQSKLSAWRKKMRAARASRVPPALDDKILTGWNGLMIASLAKGARVLNEPKYADAAADAAEFILTRMRKDGRLLRTYRAGQARLTAYLSDYAFLTEGLLNLYEATFDRRWLDEAVKLTDTSIEFYYDESNGGFFFTAKDAEKLLARSKSPRDGAIPSGNSVQAMNLLRLSVMLDRKDYREKAESIFKALGGTVARSPTSFERLLCAADFYHDRVKEIVIIGNPEADATKALLRAVYEPYLPNKVVMGAPDAIPDTKLPLLMGKVKKHGKSTAYVCEHYSCKLPVTMPDALKKQLAAQ